MKEKVSKFLKSKNGRDFIVAIIIILVAFISFGIGRFSIENEKDPIVIDINESLYTSSLKARAGESLGENIDEKKIFVASVNGGKYHFPWCPGAKQINEENKVWFKSKEEAERKGYEKALNCEDL